MKNPKPNSVEMLSAKAQIKREWGRADAKFMRRLARNPERVKEKAAVMAAYTTAVDRINAAKAKEEREAAGLSGPPPVEEAK